MKPAAIPRPAKAAARFLARALNRLLAKPGFPSDLLLIVAHEPNGEKVQAMRQRLQYFFRPLPLNRRVRVVRHASLIRILFARIVVEADAGLVPAVYRRLFAHVFLADFERNPNDGAELCRISQRLAGLPTASRRAQSRSRFVQGIERIQARGRQKTYLFGTGPSLAGAADRDFSDGYVVVCNTIVRDAALWHHLKPDILVAADTIYHFGHTAHAQAFRDDVRKRLAESDGRTLFVYPELFDAIARREFAEFDDVLVPVPFGEHDIIHLDLRERFELPGGLGNVLNVLLLPIGCTLARSVWLWGFDGRAPDDKLFWSNSSRHAYPELMPTLQEAHPAFFAGYVPKGRENTYVQSVHGNLLDDRLARAEAAGWEFVMMHFTWTETLNKRRVAPDVAS